MTQQVRGTKYRKWKSPSRPGRYSGRVHLQFYEKSIKAWQFVCGKRDGGAALNWMGAPGNVVDDDEPVTCVRCGKFAPDVVEHMDVVPDLEEFQ